MALREFNFQNSMTKKNNWKDNQHKVKSQREGILNWKDVQHKVNNQREDIQNSVKIAYK